MIRSRQCIAGAVFLLIGLFFFVDALSYQVGTARSMGPGYFPTCVALLLMLTGAGAIAQAVLQKVHDPVGPLRLQVLAVLAAALVSFALLVERAGLVVAVLAVVVLSCIWRVRQKPVEVLLLFAVLAAASVGLFIHGLGLPFNAF